MYETEVKPFGVDELLQAARLVFVRSLGQQACTVQLLPFGTLVVKSGDKQKIQS